jgi:galactokinase
VAWRPEQAGLALLVVDTGVAHALVEGGYGDRRAECERAAAEVGVEHLATATIDDVARVSPDLRGRARHVVTEQQRVGAVVDAAAAADWDTVGALLTASHDSLRDDFEVSCAELDAVVDTALAAGALGARMTGGGFGVSAIALVPADLSGQVIRAVRDAFERNGWEAPTVFPVEASSGASVAT